MRRRAKLSGPTRRRAFRVAGVVALALLAVPEVTEAQYFGRNKVQYDQFDFRVLDTPHFNIHFYPEQNEAMEDVARMAERWYERLARFFQHEFAETKPLIFYADHPDFQQTNTIGGMIGEGTGGVTEGLKNRVIMPLGESYASTDHVLGHELVHAFQFDIAQTARAGGLQRLMQLPLWMIEGMAEYLSLGDSYPLTGMWLRDALLRDDFPTLQQLTRDRRYFPYRFGHAFWVHIGKSYGDEVAAVLFRTALQRGWQGAVETVLQMDAETFSEEWRAAAEEHYGPLMEGRTAPGEAGTLLISPATGGGEQNVAPSVSPDGRYVAFMSERDLFSVDLYLADARTGEVLRRVARAESDPHSDALRFIDSSGTWSPDSQQFAYVVFARGRNEIVIRDVERGREVQRVRVSDEIGEITNPAWSPDGRHMAFSGQAGGFTDLFLVEIESGELTRLTRDRHSNLQPNFSPDGRFIAFASDRGPETDFDRLVYSEPRLSLYDLETGEVEVLDIFGNVQHSDPQFAPDGRSLFFLSDQDGFQDIYRVDLESGDVHRVTELATAVSGITSKSPAMTVARETGTVVFSVFDSFQFHIYSLDVLEAPDGPAVARADGLPGRILPPVEPAVESRVLAYLEDPDSGLVPRTTYMPAEDGRDYRPSLSLDYIGQPTIGVGVSEFGTQLGGSVFFLFSDMLGDRFLGMGVQAQGEVQDIGGQVVFQNRRHRWNWGVSAGRIPFQFLRVGGFRDPNTGNVTYLQDRWREFMTQLGGSAHYPFSTTRRVEFSGGVNRISWSVERDSIVVDPVGRLIAYDRTSRDDLTPDALNLYQASAALVSDNSVFALTSPVRGSRWRLELQQTMGSFDFVTALGDYRRYFNPFTELTVAMRGLHLGRYGGGLDGSILRPLFLGEQALVRGYSFQSLDAQECRPAEDGSQCPQFDRLFGQRIGVASAEARVPVFGVERFGLLEAGFLAAEAIAFADAGLAWSGGDDVKLAFERESFERVPVVSAGVGTRMNLFGALILEVYYAYPFQRPEKGWHFGFNLGPGW